MERAEAAMRANFELMVRHCRGSPTTDALTWLSCREQDTLGVDYWCVHDRDIAPEVRDRAIRVARPAALQQRSRHAARRPIAL